MAQRRERWRVEGVEDRLIVCADGRNGIVVAYTGMGRAEVVVVRCLLRRPVVLLFWPVGGGLPTGDAHCFLKYLLHGSRANAGDALGNGLVDANAISALPGGGGQDEAL